MFSLMHMHFESILRVASLTRPFELQDIAHLCEESFYLDSPPLKRLKLLEEQIYKISKGLREEFSYVNFLRIIEQFFIQLSNQPVDHVDLRINVLPGKWRWMISMAQGIELFREIGRKVAPHLSISFLGAINFSKKSQDITEIFRTLLEDQNLASCFKGIDINVTPEQGSFGNFLSHLDSIYCLQRQGMKVNLHLGELFENAFSKELLSHVIPNRIGHGVKLLDDPSIVAYIKDHDICLDMCPRSNQSLGVCNWNEHINPAKKALAQGIPISINTDDPILFRSTFSQEIAAAALNPEELRRVEEYGRKYAYR